MTGCSPVPVRTAAADGQQYKDPLLSKGAGLFFCSTIAVSYCFTRETDPVMNILFIHQNFPAQFKYLAPALLRAGHKVHALVPKPRAEAQLPGIVQVPYRIRRGSTKQVHPWLVSFETQTIRAEALFYEALKLLRSGYRPDVVIAHPGWGESTFVKDVWPDTRLGMYCEYYYHATGQDIGFDREFSQPPEAERCRLQMKNLPNILHFSLADKAISPTWWQRATYPEPFRSRIEVVHEGIDTRRIVPDAGASLAIADTEGRMLQFRASDEVITFVNRNLEPFRGFHSLMRALPEILERRPNAEVLLVGGNGVSYGRRPKDGGNWREVIVEELRDRIPDSGWARVHFLGNIPYLQFIRLLQVSSVHVYLSYPFVLSWSVIEAMSAGCAIVASRTEPVMEVISEGETGRLVDFFDTGAIAGAVCDLLDNPKEREQLGRNAREHAVSRYDLRRVCLPLQLAWVDRLADGQRNRDYL